jgi:hypothetical protein
MGEENSFSLLTADGRITSHVGAQEIEALLDPAAYTGRCAEVADEQADRADDLAGELLSETPSPLRSAPAIRR